MNKWRVITGARNTAQVFSRSLSRLHSSHLLERMFSFMNFRVTQSDDPLTLALTPSVHETKDQRRVRERAQAVAKRANDEIERQIARDREEEGKKKKKRPIKVVLVSERNDELLLPTIVLKTLYLTGQSGSGKTAMMRGSLCRLGIPSCCFTGLTLFFFSV
jgi:hypothetical protein